MKVISCEGLVKRQGKFRALDHVSFSIEENTITGLVGRNGAGKTTLLKILAGYWNKTAGKVDVLGQDPFQSLEVSVNSIFVDDMMSFSHTLSLKQVFEEASHFYPNWDMELALGLLQYFQFRPELPHQSLSKGRKSTFNAIVGLAARCPLTIFDEPTTGMDAAVRKDFYRALLKDYINSPRTIIISSHYLEEVEDLLEDVLLIDEGRKLLHIPIEEMREYAVGLSGRTALVMQCLQDKEVLYKRKVDNDNCYVVVRNDFDHEKVKRIGIHVASVAPNDLCVYLGSQAKGEIDDVFSKHEYN